MLKRIYQKLSLLLLTILIVGCTGNDPVPQEDGGEGSKIFGTISYDRVPAKVDASGTAMLDYNNIRIVSGKYLLVKALDENGQVLAQTTSDAYGNYVVYVPEDIPIKIRVYARMFKENIWDLSVVDNTNGKAMYVIEGALHSSGSSTSKRDLHAASGWDGQSYSSSRDAAPFAILDSINTVMQKVVQANPQVTFPHLLVNWSVNNVSVGGDANLGQIGTSSYTGDSNLWILGDANADTDEYDDHIIIHEWAHFFEDKFSRSDSIGGRHASGDALDIRVAFGEGFGNAMSAIATDDPIYFDTSGYGQSSGWFMNIETARQDNPGWFSEASVQRILYDLYDSNNDGHDSLDLGFTPIFNAMVDKERNTKAFTSIFTFIHALKTENASYSTEIDQVVSSENINTIYDIYGSYRSNSANGMFTTPIYRTLEVNQWINQCNKNNYGVYNKLGNRSFMRVHIDTADIYKFEAKPFGATYGDPDIVIYKAQYPYDVMGMSPREGDSSDELAINLEPGDYMIEVYDNSYNNSCFVVNLVKDQTLYSGKMTKGSIINSKLLMNHRRPERRAIQ